MWASCMHLGLVKTHPLHQLSPPFGKKKPHKTILYRTQQNNTVSNSIEQYRKLLSVSNVTIVVGSLYSTALLALAWPMQLGPHIVITFQPWICRSLRSFVHYIYIASMIHAAGLQYWYDVQKCNVSHIIMYAQIYSVDRSRHCSALLQYNKWGLACPVR